MRPTNRPYILWRENLGLYEINITGSPIIFQTALAVIKMLPVSERHFDANTKKWYITEQCFKAAKIGLEAVYKETISILEKANPIFANKTSNVMESENMSEEDKKLLTFVKLLPPDVLATAYKQALLQLHPDRGGSTDKTAELNAAFTWLKQNYIKKLDIKA